MESADSRGHPTAAECTLLIHRTCHLWETGNLDVYRNQVEASLPAWPCLMFDAHTDPISAKLSEYRFIEPPVGYRTARSICGRKVPEWLTLNTVVESQKELVVSDAAA